MKRHAETPVQNLTLERKESFRGAQKEAFENPIIPLFFARKPDVFAVNLTPGSVFGLWRAVKVHIHRGALLATLSPKLDIKVDIS